LSGRFEEVEVTGRALVIVESPTKARTIRRFLGDQFRVEASMGHVRDLPSSATEVPAAVKGEPWARLAVDVDHGFAPVYIVPADKKKVVAQLKKELADADVLYIATDEDREGESIGWHLLELLKPKIPTHRMVFHEITREAIQKALDNPRDLDVKLVQAQEARRVLDRLVGYVVSPLLWRKVAPRLSAGRVQSVAVRMMVQRERERMAFRSGAWWDVKATGEKLNDPHGLKFDAGLVSLSGRTLATGRDFDETTGKVRPNRDVLLLDEGGARALAQRLAGCTFTVDDVDRKESQRSPYPPFTTSTLQQEANRKLGLPAAQTMQIAQRLYEEGHITYMRTDSVNLSEEAISAVRNMISRRYGPDLMSPQVRRYATKSKGAQEAHEAIRPAGTTMATASELGLSGREARLYDLIWKRTVATQMANARIASTTVTLSVPDPADGKPAVFRASGRQVLFPGFFRAYVEGSDDPSGLLDDQSNPLPNLDPGDKVRCVDLLPQGHETRPPGRFTEATLVKALEAEGIGRPSTYASIIDTIQKRGYVRAVEKQLVPTFTAMAVTSLLEVALTKVVDTEFTAVMEGWLDQVAEGASDHLTFLQSFYTDVLLGGVAQGEQIDPRQVCTVRSQALEPFEVRLGRYGPFIEILTPEGGRRVVSLPEDVAPADLTADVVRELAARAEKGEAPLGHHPESGLPVYLRDGRFGAYVQLGEATEEGDKPRRSSLPQGVQPAQVTLDMALSLLALPRALGTHPETQKPVVAGLGRFGPYVAHDGVFASLKKEDDLFRIGLPRALELFSLKGAGRKTAEPLRNLGDHPEGGGAIVLLDGRYGAYVKHGSVNATLPEGLTVEDITLAQAIELLSAKAGKAKPAARGRTRKAAAEPAAPRKAAAAKAKPAAAKAKPAAAKAKPAAAKAKPAAAKAKPAAAQATPVEAAPVEAEPTVRVRARAKAPSA
jgi:DNA topoisomerase-1